MANFDQNIADFAKAILARREEMGEDNWQKLFIKSEGRSLSSSLRRSISIPHNPCAEIDMPRQPMERVEIDLPCDYDIDDNSIEFGLRQAREMRLPTGSLSRKMYIKTLWEDNRVESDQEMKQAAEDLLRSMRDFMRQHLNAQTSKPCCEVDLPQTPRTIEHLSCDPYRFIGVDMARPNEAAFTALDASRFFEDEVIEVSKQQSCVFNANSAHLKCAVNPTGDCETCPHFEEKI
jgi:hypothetical protein